jgi:Protein of unknown function, DUF547.
MNRNLPIIIALACAFALRAANDPIVPDVAAFDRILKTYVLEDGTVRYAALKADLGPLSRFVDQIGAVSPDSHPRLFPDRPHKLAYWLNTYNALVLWAMAKEYPEKKDQLKTLIGRYRFFMSMKFKAGGRDLSLNDIETNAIRKQFQEPRIHFAVVCASMGCPWLSRDAFQGERLEGQLVSRTTLFVNQERNVRLNRARREAELSQIFQWYAQDFGASTEELLSFIGKYRTTDGAELHEGKWKVRYFKYDWGINEAKPDRKTAP